MLPQWLALRDNSELRDNVWLVPKRRTHADLHERPPSMRKSAFGTDVMETGTQMHGCHSGLCGGGSDAWIEMTEETGMIPWYVRCHSI